MFEPEDRVRVRQGVFTGGYDLSGRVGFVKSNTSYIEVFFPDLQQSFKMLRYEIELSDKFTVDELEQLLYSDE